VEKELANDPKAELKRGGLADGASAGARKKRKGKGREAVGKRHKAGRSLPTKQIIEIVNTYWGERGSGARSLEPGP